jgi:hypothetical protein
MLLEGMIGGIILESKRVWLVEFIYMLLEGIIGGVYIYITRGNDWWYYFGMFYLFFLN